VSDLRLDPRVRQPLLWPWWYALRYGGWAQLCLSGRPGRSIGRGGRLQCQQHRAIPGRNERL